MKKFSKTLLSVAAVTAVTAAMAASAMAAELVAEYADGTVTLKDVESRGASQTIIVLNEKGNTEGVTTENANEVVKQIDQKDDNTVFETVKVGNLADGTYYVRIGGTDGKMQTATFTVGEGGGEPGSDRLLGDVDGSKTVDVADSVKVVNYVLKSENFTGDSLQAADTDDNATVDVGDAVQIVNYVVGNESTITDGATIADKSQTVTE